MGGFARGVAAQVRMKRAVILDDTAARELRERLVYLASVSPGAERMFWRDFARLLDLLSQFPELHEEYGRRLRRAVLKRWSLGIFYRPTTRVVIVVGLVDLRRD